MRKAASSRRPRAAAVPGSAEPAAGAGGGTPAAPRAPMPIVAKLLEQGFRAAAAKAVADTHAAGLPVASVDPQGRPVWRHPDGTLEAMTDPARIPTRPQPALAPLLVVVAGPNGSGKTTLVRQGVLEQVLRPPWIGQDGDGAPPVPFPAPPMLKINPDDLAAALAGGGQPTPEQSLRAAQACDDLLDAEIAAGRPVLVETVLSSDKLQRRVQAAKAAGYAVALVYVTLRHEALNVARVALRRAQGGHGVPPDRVLDRRARSHGRFAWFAERADFVAVFENSAEPVCAAMKRGARWWLWRLDLLPPDLAAAVDAAAAGHGPGGASPPPS